MVMLYNTHPKPLSYTSKIYNIARHTCYYSEKYSLDPVLVLSLQKHESNYRPKVVSRTNDCGLMQINDPDGDCIQECNLKKIHCNIKRGTRYLYRVKRNCLTRHDHSYWIRHYNWNSKNHYWKILWLTKAFKEAYLNNSFKIYKTIKTRSYPRKFPKCIMRNDFCIS